MPVIVESLSNTSPSDEQDLRRLLSELPEHDVAPLQPERWLKQSNHQLWVGRFNGRVAGALWSRADEGQTWLEFLAVRRATRRHGVGRRIVQVVSEQAQGLAVMPGNNTQELLVSLGFHPSGQQMVHSPD